MSLRDAGRIALPIHAAVRQIGVCRVILGTSKNTVGEPFMAPGGEMFRFYSAFRRERTAYPGGMNASPTVKTQCVRKSSNTNLLVPPAYGFAK